MEMPFVQSFSCLAISSMQIPNQKLMGQPGKERIALEDHAAVRGRTFHFLIVQEDLAGGGIVQASQDADEGGFATAGGADDTDKFTSVYVEQDVVEGDDVAIGPRKDFAEVLDFQDNGALANFFKPGSNVRFLFQVAR